MGHGVRQEGEVKNKSERDMEVREDVGIREAATDNVIGTDKQPEGIGELLGVGYGLGAIVVAALSGGGCLGACRALR